MIEILQIVVGALITVIFVIYIEKKKLPELDLIIESPTLDMKYPPNQRPANRHKALRVIVKNQSLTKLFGLWLSRDAALNCRASITFHHLDGQNFFGRTMNGRWATTPQPAPLVGQVGNQKLILFDHTRMTDISRVDIYAGDESPLDIAGRFDTDSEAYGWCNDNYFSNPVWRAPQWRLPNGRYLIKVSIVSGNCEASALFRLINDVSIDDFRLEPAQDTDKVI